MPLEICHFLHFVVFFQFFRAHFDESVQLFPYMRLGANFAFDPAPVSRCLAHTQRQLRLHPLPDRGQSEQNSRHLCTGVLATVNEHRAYCPLPNCEQHSRTIHVFVYRNLMNLYLYKTKQISLYIIFFTVFKNKTSYFAQNRGRLSSIPCVSVPHSFGRRFLLFFALGQFLLHLGGQLQRGRFH